MARGGTGKRKIEIKKITNQSSRKVAFSKRRKGLFKKAVELESKTGAQVAILVFSPAGKRYTCGDIQSHCSEIPSASPASNGMWDSFNVETCNDVNELLMFKAHLERTKEKLEESEFFDSLWA